MKKEIMELWVNELESGYWQQGTLFLEHSGMFCVNGILANIAATYGVCSHSGNNMGLFDNEILELPTSVIEWAEMKESPGLLAEMNDKGKSFKVLAEYIRKHWESL